MKIIFIILVLHLVSTDSFSILKKKIYQNVRFIMEPCNKDIQNPFVIRTKNIKITGGVDSITFSYELELLEDVHSPFGTKYEMVRCPILNRNECEKQPSIEIKDFCELDEKILPLTKVLTKSMMEPPLDCPVYKKGVHRIRNTTMDLTALSMLPMDGYHWKVKETRYFGKDRKPLLCATIEGTVRVFNPNRNRHGKKQ